MRVHLQHSGGGTGSARNRRKQRHRARTGSTRIHSPPPSYSKVHSDLLLCFMQIFDFCIVNFSKQVYFFLHRSNDGKVSLNRFYCRTYSTWFIALECFAYLSCSLHIPSSAINDFSFIRYSHAQYPGSQCNSVCKNLTF